MEEKLENELRNPENWDFDRAKTEEPVKNPRVVVSVSFPHEDFVSISKCAERLGKKTSEFIREAALDRARNRGPQTVVYDYGSTGPLWFDRKLPTSTRAQTLIKERKPDEHAFTS